MITELNIKFKNVFARKVLYWQILELHIHMNIHTTVYAYIEYIKDNPSVSNEF